MILPDSQTYGQSFCLYVLANTDEPLTASAIASLNENARASGGVRQALKKLFDEGYLMRRKSTHAVGRGARPYEYTIKPIDIDQYLGFEEHEWEATDE
jgi:predicted transcriptional regulator